MIAIVGASARHAWLTVSLLLLLAAAGLTYTAGHLRIDTDTDNLFAKSLPWRQSALASQKNFPQFSRLIVAVVRAATPEEATETAVALNQSLSADKRDFHDSTYPANAAFYPRTN
jgi:predicted RND superfamily exporter protein